MDRNPRSYLWQSFNYMEKNFLTKYEIKCDFGHQPEKMLEIMEKWRWSSMGKYTIHVNSHGAPHIFMCKDLVDLFRSKPWERLRSDSIPNITKNLWRWVKRQRVPLECREERRFFFFFFNYLGTIYQIVSGN